MPLRELGKHWKPKEFTGLGRLETLEAWKAYVAMEALGVGTPVRHGSLNSGIGLCSYIKCSTKVKISSFQKSVVLPYLQFWAD